MGDLSLPKVLYKYRRWDLGEKDRYDHRSLTGPELYFASPKKFNDPFDCRLGVGYELRTNEQTIQYFKEKYGDRAFATETLLKEDPQGLLEAWRSAIDNRVDKESGVCCFSATATNPLLWGHYADGSRGFCIGYDSLHLREYFEFHQYHRDCILALINVEYRPELPSLDPFIQDDIEWLHQQYRYKSMDWKYEEEIRALMFDKNEVAKEDRALEIPAVCIAAVILGCQFDRRANSEIFPYIRRLQDANRSLTLLRAEKSKTRFELELHPLAE